jgi:hypothetical protein
MIQAGKMQLGRVVYPRLLFLSATRDNNTRKQITLRLSGSPTQLRIKATHRRVRSKRLFDVSFAFDEFGLRFDNEWHRLRAHISAPQITEAFPFLSQMFKLRFISGPSFDNDLHDVLAGFKELATWLEGNRNNIHRTGSLKRFAWLKNNKLLARLTRLGKCGRPTCDPADMNLRFVLLGENTFRVYRYQDIINKVAPFVEN